MKYLKLAAEFEGARKLAECLIGNYCDKDKTYTLNSVFEYKNGWTFGCYDFEDKYFGFLQIIEIPIDAIKICPFMAMKNEINVKAKCARFEKGYQGFCGRAYYMECGPVVFNLTNLDGELTTKFGANDITLDFNNLPEGCEIFEFDEVKSEGI